MWPTNLESLLKLAAMLASALLLAAGLILGEETLRDRLRRTGSVLLRWTIYSVLD